MPTISLNIFIKFIKFSFSDKVTKLCAIVPMVLTFNKKNVKTIRMISQIIVAFSEKVNFTWWPDKGEIRMSCVSKGLIYNVFMLFIHLFINDLTIWYLCTSCFLWKFKTFMPTLNWSKIFELAIVGCLLSM